MPGIIRKDGRLMHWAIVFLAAIFLLLTCHDNEQAAKAAKAAEEAHIEREVARRVGVARKEMAERDALLHTVSLAGIIVLTGGAVVRILWGRRRPRFVASVMPADRVVQTNRGGDIQQIRPPWNAYQPPRVGRVIDLRPVVSSPPIQQPAQQQPGWTRQRRRRRWNRDPNRQPNPPRRQAP